MFESTRTLVLPTASLTQADKVLSLLVELTVKLIGSGAFCQLQLAAVIKFSKMQYWVGESEAVKVRL
jgi:hypothetical protein